MNRRLSLPVKVTTDQTELLIVNAIGGGDDFGEFGVAPSAAVCVVEPDTGDRVFVTGLSAVLDEATDVFRSFNPGGGQFFKRDGLFIADDGTDLLSAVVAREKTDATSRRPRKKSLWQQVIAVLPWVHEEPIAEPLSTPTRRATRRCTPHHLDDGRARLGGRRHRRRHVLLARALTSLASEPTPI